MKTKIIIKRIAVLLSIMIILSMIVPAYVSAETSLAPTIKISAETVKLGETADVSVELIGNPGIVSATLSVSFDKDALTLTAVKDMGLLGTQSHKDKLVSPYSLVWVNDTATENFNNIGVIAVLTFKVNENAAQKAYPIKVSYDFDNYDIYDKDLNQIEFRTQDGSITVRSAETKPTESKPTATESKPTEPKPTMTESKPTEPTVTEPSETKPTEPTVTEPSESKPTEPTVTEPSETKPTEPAVTEPTEPTATEPTVTIPTATEPTVTEFTATEPTVTEPTMTEPQPTEPTATVKKTTVKLSKTSAKLYVKQIVKISATVKNGKGKTTFKSSNKKVAKVNSKGIVTAVKKGTTKITVTNNGVKKIFTVKVKNPKLNKTKITLKKGKTFALKITGKVGKAKFTTNKKSIATVTKTGKITAKTRGKATITVKTNGITLKATVTVKIE